MRNIGADEINIPYEYRQVAAEQRSVYGIKAPSAESMTAFSNDPMFTQSDMALAMPIEGSGFGGGDVSIEQGMDSFLYKGSFTWSKDQARGTDIKTMNLPFDLISASQGDMQSTKFRQMTYYRTDMEVRVQTNGTALQYGALLMQWLPLCDKTRTLVSHDDLS